MAPLCILALACAAPRVDFDTLSAEPIALTHWDAEAGRRRAELLDQEPSGGAQRMGVANVSDIGRYLSRSDRVRAVEQKYPGRLVLLDPRTRELSRVEQAPAGARALAWSPDHQRLLFSSAHRAGVHHIYELDRVTGNVRRLSRGDANHVLGAYGPDRRLAFATFRMRGGEVETSLAVTQPGGLNPEPILENVPVQDLSFAPDGSRVVFTVLEDPRNAKAEGRPVLVSREPRPGGDARALGRGKNPVFTPDGEWIVFSAPVKVGWRIKRMRPDGSARISVGGGVVDEFEPAVAPDGSSIVYVANTTGLDQLFVRRFDGSGDRLLYGDGAVAYPVW
ncbi:MAG: PD40 domain-containing protein [Deltaproteobacteria bacterium]|nr:PD40 domain-containing protein [Deltaproteobacteria bacterium]MBW2417726.1 PD40 domain-containing protein [Deltaproteobacteria bacterium]